MNARAAATLAGAVHATRFALWLGVESAARDLSLRAYRLERRAGQRARAAEADLERVTGTADPAPYTVQGLIDQHSWELDRA